MRIIDLLKDENARVTIGRSWLVWDDSTKEWVVYTQLWGAKKARVLYRGDSEEDAVKVLMQEHLIVTQVVTGSSPVTTAIITL